MRLGPKPMVTALALPIKVRAKRLETNDFGDMEAECVSFVEFALLAMGQQGKSQW